MSGRSSRHTLQQEKEIEEIEEMAQHSGDPLLVKFERVRGGGCRFNAQFPLAHAGPP